jgi:hypothetical protein
MPSGMVQLNNKWNNNMRSISELELNLVGGGTWAQGSDGVWSDPEGGITSYGEQTGERPSGFSAMDGAALGGFGGGVAGLGSVVLGGGGAVAAGDIIAAATVVGGVVGLTAAVVGIGVVAAYSRYQNHNRVQP